MVVRLEHVGLRYGRDDAQEVLRDLNFSVPAGGFRWLLGPSGAGKSSLLRLLYLDVRPSRGRLVILNAPIAIRAGRAERAALPRLRRRIGVVFQDFRLLPHLSAYDNVALPLRLAGRPEGQIGADVREIMGWVGLAKKHDARPPELSGGEQQRVAIARAVIHRPALLLADEPTGNLDDAQAERLMQLLKEMNRIGTTVIVATHNEALVDRHPAAKLRLSLGRLIDDEGAMADRPDRAQLRAERTAQRLDDRRGKRLRPARFDDLGLRSALSDRLLPSLVAAMAFLAALALAGFVGADTLGAKWRAGAGASLTIQVPQPGAPAATEPAPVPTRRDAVLGALAITPGLGAARALSEGDLADLLRPWLGTQAEAISVPLPAVIEASIAATPPDLTALRARLDKIAPGTLVENQNAWAARLAALAHSLQACTGLALIVVVAVAAAVVAVATRAGLVSRRGAIEIVHGLGATDRYIAGRFAARTARLALAGAAAGAVGALPVLLALASLAAPFAGTDPEAPRPGWLAALPLSLWIALPCLPLVAGTIGWLAAQVTVRRWLQRLA